MRVESSLSATRVRRAMTIVPATRSGSCTISAMYPGTTMPPAARPRVSENMRLITRPRPMASSTMTHRRLVEVEDDLLAETHDVADAEHDTAVVRKLDNLLEDLLPGELPEIAQAMGREPLREHLPGDQPGSFSCEDDVIGLQALRHQLRDLGGAMEPVAPAVGEHQRPASITGSEAEPLPDQDRRVRIVRGERVHEDDLLSFRTEREALQDAGVRLCRPHAPEGCLTVDT